MCFVAVGTHVLSSHPALASFPLTLPCPTGPMPHAHPQGLTHISQERAELRTMLCRWVPAFAKTLMCHLRRDRDLYQELQVRGHACRRQPGLSLLPA